MKHNIRLFVAAPLPGFVTEELKNYLEPYEKPGIKILPAENWHLTFHFIGNVPSGQFPEISRKLKELSVVLEPFTLKLLRVAPGPTARSPRLVWAVLSENKTFEKAIRKITIGLGAKMDNQHPIPHITLARYAKELIKPPKLPVIGAENNLSFQVSELALWESELGRSHPKYTILETFALSGGITPQI